jgi:hypothetical protein
MGSESDVSDARPTRPASAIRSTAHRIGHSPVHLTIPAGDWETLLTTRANAVVVGTEDAALRLWTAVWPALQKPIYWVEADRLSLPRVSAGTVILQHAHLLGAPDQQRVFEWLERDARATRVLTTTPQPLFPLVEGGRFLESLYYRLNMLLLIL